MFQNEKISISVSNLNFSSKPETEKCYSKLVFTPSSLDLAEITDYIDNGYALSHIFFNYSNSTFKTRQKKNDNFVHAQSIAIDLDKCEYNTLSSLLSGIELVPSIAYTTLSHKTKDAEGKDKGNRYRLLYCFDKKITSVAEYRHIYNCVVKYLKLQIPTLVDDTKMVNPSQMFFGSSAHDVNKEVYNNNVIYSKSQFVDNNTEEEEEDDDDYEYNSTFKKKETELLISNQKFMSDFNDKNVGNQDLVKRYQSDFLWFEKTPLPEVPDTQMYIMLPPNYYEIKRYYFKEDTGRTVKKLSDGEHRKRILYTNAILRRLMFPGISFDHLLYCLMVELTQFCINKKDFITRKQIYSIAKSAYETDLEDDKVIEMSNEYKVSKKWVINMSYAVKHGTTTEYLRNKVNGELTKQILLENYNSELSVKKNLEIFQERGIDLKKSTLYNYRRELLGKPKKEKKAKEVKVVLVDFAADDFCKAKNKLSKKYSKELKKWNWVDEDFEIINNKVKIKDSILNTDEKKHISAPTDESNIIVAQPCATKTNEIIKDVEPQTENKMENEETLIKEYKRISKEVIKQTENYRKKDIIIIVDSIKDFEYKFNNILTKEDLDDLFESLETNCLNIIKERIEDHYRRNKYENIDINKVLDYYVPNVTPEYQQEITDLIESLHSKHINN